MAVQSVKVPPNLAAVLDRAGQKSNVDFDYLLQTAVRESSLNPRAKASSSSATGLFQFLDQTWLEVMKSDGGRLGYQKYADAISQDANGEYTIRDKALRQKVLKLREDPQVAADLAAAFTRNNGAYLKEKFGRMPSPGELYIAHFLGARGAEKLFRAGLENPNQSAASLFARQAAANPSIFYRDGKALTVKQLYQGLVAQHAALSHSVANVQGPTAAPLPAALPDSRFAVQQMADTKAGQGDADVRFSLSFRALYSNAPRPPGEPLVTQPKTANGSFFTGFYGD